MISFNFLVYYIGLNALLYLLIHIPLDTLIIINRQEKQKEGAKDYPRWEEGKSFTKIVTVLASLYFWIFFICWPIFHLFSGDGLLLIFNFEIPYVGTVIQYTGLILIGAGTFIACIGRIARGRKAISWGVPKELTTRWGFRIVRHPLYASYCYYFIGIPLAMQNYLLLPMILGVIGYYLTAKYEEKILEAEFGENYYEYQKRVGMMIPFIGRRKNDNN